MSDVLREIESFVEAWPESPDRNKQAFLHFKDYLEVKPGVSLEFHPRPQLTYSLRAVHENQKGKALFVLVDVIEDTPRWLSVCFYGEMINDPEEKGDFVPEGLLGEDALCFDLEAFDEEGIAYIEARLEEAFQSAAKG